MSFRALREASGLSQAQLARKLEMNPSAIARWDTGKTRPKLEILPRLAEIYGCTVDDLLRLYVPKNTEAVPEQTSR